MASDYDFESSDILGGFLPVGPRRVAQNSGFSSFFKICALGASTLLLLLAFRHGRTFFLRWKERHYKLSMRRRYGIPDHDHRPFNVAYATARLAHNDSRKLQDRMRNVPFDQPNTLGHGSTGPEEGYGLAAHPSPTPVTLQVSGLDKNAKQITQRLPFSAGSATQPLRAAFSSSHPHPDVSEFRTQPESGHANTRDEDAKDKREAKPEGDHLVHDSGIDVDSAPAPRRSKRVADSSDDSDLRYSQENRQDKRRRKVSSRHLKKRMQKGDAVEMNGPSEVKMTLGGKKRDRTEMDSSFGTEDDILYDQDIDFALHRHRRRRQRNSTNSSRGQKRGRDVDPLGVDTDSDLRGRRKAFRHRPDTSDTDPSVEDGQLSRDPLCRGRRIGEEWEAHGVQFRVGSDGKRLRRVLVKEDRPKFNMPVDSEHPDRSASVTAIVERWYTEEQYTAAKEAHELAWQDSDKSFAEGETPGDRSGNPTSAGKQLLWASTSNTGSPVRKIRISGHSSIASPRIVSFPMFPPPQYTRRISTSLYNSSSVTPTEMSPKLRQSKSYSKWEKQEIEAEAIARLRRKAEEKEKAKAEAEAKEVEAKKVAASTLTLPKPDEKPSVAPPSGATAFSLPPPNGGSKAIEPSNPPPLFKIPTVSLNSQSSEAKDKPQVKTAAAAPTNLFPFPSAPNSNPATQTAASFPAASRSVLSNSTTPTFFTNITQPTTAPTSAPDTRGSAASSLFSFGQTKAPSNNPISNPSSAPQGNGSSTAPQGMFSLGQNPKPPTSTENSSNTSASAVPAGGTSDASKPKFNFGMTSKPTSVNPSNPLAGATPSDAPPKLTFSFGAPKNSPAPTGQAVTNPFGNPPASSMTTAQATQPPVFGMSEGKSAGTPTSGIMPASSGFKLSEGASSTNQGQSTAGVTGNTTTLFGASNAGTQAQGGATKPPSFAPTGLSTTKPFFSFKGGSDTSKPEPGKGPTTFSFNGSSPSSTPAAVPPTPGSVFSNTAPKSSQGAEAITQPLFGGPKNAGAPSTFTFGQSSGSGPFSFGSQKS